MHTPDLELMAEALAQYEAWATTREHLWAQENAGIPPHRDDWIASDEHASELLYRFADAARAALATPKD